MPFHRRERRERREEFKQPLAAVKDLLHSRVRHPHAAGKCPLGNHVLIHMKNHGKAAEHRPRIIVFLETELAPALLGHERAEPRAVLDGHNELRGEFPAHNLGHGAAKQILRGARRLSLGLLQHNPRGFDLCGH